MKFTRLINCAVCLILAASLFSCSKAEESTISLPESFSLNALITDGDFEASAKMKRSVGGWQITITAPETIEGMKISYTDIDCKIELDELSYTVSLDELSNSSPLRLTVNALDKCVKGKKEGEILNEEYSFEFNEDGSPKALEIGSISAVFSEYTY